MPTIERGGDEKIASKPPIGISPLKFIDEVRGRINYNRAIEISEAIIKHCSEEKPWPPKWNDEMNYIVSQTWKLQEEGGVEG